MSARGQFSSRLGFILAAAGSAVGLGNIWGFPTQVAENGGAAFVVMYIILAFILAYPVLMAELLIGRYSGSNMVDALGKIGGIAGRATGVWGFVTVSLILSFYALVAGWMIAYCLSPLMTLFGQPDAAQWLITQSLTRDLIFAGVFFILTAGIVYGGVAKGIERWSVRLMPTLFVLIFALIIYVGTQQGAVEGFKRYLVPDFSLALKPDLLIDAMGQAFFSMSLGVGTMLVYGSYISKRERITSLGASVALVDIGVAILAGLLIIPAMYVAAANGVEIFLADGALKSGDQLIFTVLPALFDTMGGAGVYIAFVFFALMVVAAITSSISMLEVPVAYVTESKGMNRHVAVWLIAAVIFAISATIAMNFEALFGLVITATTKYSQPLLGLVLCLFAGWVWRRDAILSELKAGDAEAEHSLFWKIWPWYVRFVCPVVIIVMFYRSL